MRNFQNHYDILLVGAGIVGATLACLLARQGLRIGLLDKQTPQLNNIASTYQARVSAINRASENVFSNLGIWQQLTVDQLAAYEAMHIWDAMGEGRLHFDCADIAAVNLGYIVENRWLLQALKKSFVNYPELHYLAPVVLQKVTMTSDKVELNLEDGRLLTASLLVGTDGSQSWVRQQTRIQVVSGDYHQTAIIAVVKTELTHANTAWQRFLPTGPLAFLPLAGKQHSAIVWSAESGYAKTLQAMGDVEFKGALAQALQLKLGTVIEVSDRQAFPLQMQHAKQYVADRIALVGDAAHTIHPLAGQGLNLGILDAACLAEVIGNAKRKQQDIGKLKVLRRYERWRKGNNLGMLAAMAGFKWLFSNEQFVLAKLRNMGLQLTQQLPPVKGLFMRKALGVSGELPTLAKQEQ